MKNDAPETVFEGIGVAHGIATGTAWLVQTGKPEAPEYALAPHAAAEETRRFDAAVEQAQRDVTALREKTARRLTDDGGEDVLLLLDAHLSMLSGSRLVRGTRRRIVGENINAEAAVLREAEAVAAQFARLEDAYIAARGQDVRDVAYRIARILMNAPALALSDVPPDGILLTREISPADTTLLDPRRFGGIATVHGGATGHTAVVARSIGLPAVLGLPPALLDVAHHGAPAIVDGIAGKLFLNPSAATRRFYDQKLQDLKQDRAALQKLVQEPAKTLDGELVVLRANLELPREMENVKAAGADGIGLFRTEFLFMNRDTLPAEEEQFEALVEITRAMKGAPVTFRTLDIGGDKLARALGDHMASANPALGLRAIRLSLKIPQLLETQFRAILRAAYFGPVRILLPMVTTASEVEEARRLLTKAHAALKKEGVAAGDIPPLGVMIEVPAAALAADSLAAVADFFALGTNDLIQYTVAIDRGNDQVADLFNPLNPAVLRLMEFSIEAGLRAGIPVSICGEMAADPKYTPLLLGLGVRELSIGCASLPRIKQRIRSLAAVRATEHARHVLGQYDPDRIQSIVNGFRA